MNLSEVIGHPGVKRARELIRELEGDTLAEQLRIVAIPAPSHGEGARAEYVRQQFCRMGLQRCHLDEAGNALAVLPRSGTAEAAPLVIAAHLDTVFGFDTDLTLRHVGSRVYAPGITDNSRGVSALLTIARTLTEVAVETERPIWFVGTVGEEGSGDLKGTKHLFGSGGSLARPSAFIALDGSGIRRIVHRAIGARRLRVELAGPGGHSWSDFGTANPLHALGKGIDRILSLPRPTRTLVTLTVARAGGGTSVNAIPNTAWLELDLRSEAYPLIVELETACRQAFKAVVESENRERRHGTDPMVVQFRVIGDRPAGQIAENTPLIEAAVAATRLVGARPELVASSTDSNVPLSLGIPAVTLGAGGESGGIHTEDEWFCNREGARGLERALLTILAAAGVV